jgi:hypothetical protein
MVHKTRVYQALLATVDEAVTQLHDGQFTLCCAFEVAAHDKLFYIVNDAFSEDGAQEYAVLWALHDAGNCRVEVVEVESITVSWVKSAERLLELFEEAMQGTARYGKPFMLSVSHPDAHGRCHLCA